jgi:hypothetical protein
MSVFEEEVVEWVDEVEIIDPVRGAGVGRLEAGGTAGASAAMDGLAGAGRLGRNNF